MKNLFSALTLLLSFSSISAQTPVYDSVFMGQGYRNEVYYKLSTGFVDTIPVKTWDLAFSAVGGANEHFYAILANHSNGVVITKNPNTDISGWATFDTTGKSAWRTLWNTDSSWDYGAFNRNPENHPNYSWGVYTASGEITGDSLYLMTMGSGPSTQYKKLWIVQRKSASGVRTWNFRYANLDGTQDTTITLNDADYANKYFSYFSVRNNVALNREPVSTAWDIVFTRYYAAQSSPTVPYYQVTGILQNRTVKAIKATGAPVNDIPDAERDDARFSSNISTLGYDWKTFNNSTFMYDIPDSTAYFIRIDSVVPGDNLNTKIYKIVFTEFTGSANGKTVFYKELISDYTSTVGLAESPNTLQTTVYPNPASDNLSVLFDAQGKSSISVTDLTGRRIFSTEVLGNGFQHHAVDVSSFKEGIYFIRIQNGNSYAVQKFMVN